VNKINEKWAICTTSTKDPTYECVNLFSLHPKVVYKNQLIDMKGHIISNVNIVGEPKIQYCLEKGYKYSISEYPKTVTQFDCDLGSRFLDQHYTAIEKVMKLNYDDSLILNLDKYAEITIKIISIAS
jgi:hypothetical protein